MTTIFIVNPLSHISIQKAKWEVKLSAEAATSFDKVKVMGREGFEPP
jgi:hypothetical protein